MLTGLGCNILVTVRVKQLNVNLLFVQFAFSIHVCRLLKQEDMIVNVWVKWSTFVCLLDQKYFSIRHYTPNYMYYCYFRYWDSNKSSRACTWLSAKRQTSDHSVWQKPQFSQHLSEERGYTCICHSAAYRYMAKCSHRVVYNCQACVATCFCNKNPVRLKKNNNTWKSIIFAWN